MNVAYIPPDTVTLLLAAVSALAGCVALLFHQSRANFLQCQKREEQCAVDYRELLERVVKVETRDEVYRDIERRLGERRGP